MAMKPAASRIARWLPLAAAPTFAIMAVFTGIAGDRAHMIPMYLLMSVFNVAPWLQVFARRQQHSEGGTR
jgi:fatty acid desaturase